MKARITGSLALLLCVSAVHAQQAPPLQIGTPQRATLAAGTALRYELDLPSGHFVAGRVDQDEVDATVTITGPAGGRIQRASRVGRGGPESFAFATATAGRYVIEVASATAGTGGAVQVRLTRSEPVATTPEGKLDQAAAQLHKDTPGAVVGVIKAGKLAFVKAYGAADLTYGMPFTAETPTNIGSSSKQFTGFAITLLASRGKLAWDDDVRKHIPELPDFGKTITVRHLLSHTTGYREFVNTLIIEGRQVVEGDHIAPDEVIKVIQRQTKLQNEPGAEFNYNNSAFSLATIVLERVTGRPFPEWMREEVFLPLGMTQTWVRANPGQIIPGRSNGYIPGAGGFREVRDLHAAVGAGGIYTTPGDMAKWMGNFKTGQLGGPDVIRELTTSGVLNGGAPTNYGKGLFLDTNRGLKRWQHGGNDVAHSSTFVYFPDLDAGYVVFSNYQGVPGGIAGVVADAFFGEHMTAARGATPAAGGAPPTGTNPAAAAPRVTEAPPIADLTTFVGRYFSNELETFYELTVENGRLVIRHRRFGPVALTRINADTFSGTLPVSQIVFRRDAQGNVTGFDAGNGRARGIAFMKVNR